MATYFVYNSKIHVEQTSYDEDAIVSIPPLKTYEIVSDLNLDDFGYDPYTKGYDTYTGIFALNNKQYKR